MASLFGSIMSGDFGFKALQNIFSGKSVSDSVVGAANSVLGKDEDASNILGQVQTQARKEYLEDRKHTEQREDTAYQRAVVDMRKAGLNPYTIGAGSGASSSPSSVGQNTINTKLQTLGYILDLKNLDLKNKQLANQAIGNLLGFLKK